MSNSTKPDIDMSDMSPEAITRRLDMVFDMFELGFELTKAKDLGPADPPAVPAEKKT